MHPFHFTLDGKTYSRQVIYREREAEVYQINHKGKLLFRFRDDDSEDCAGIEEVEVTEIKELEILIK